MSGLLEILHGLNFQGGYFPKVDLTNILVAMGYKERPENSTWSVLLKGNKISRIDEDNAKT